jgi:hypothetical protein
VEVVFRPFDSFAGQCNAGLSLIATPWVLSLDADYLVAPDFEDLAVCTSGQTAGYQIRFRYCIYGRPLRACLYPPRTVLYQRDAARYHNDGHGHKVLINGTVETLNTHIDHDDRKPLARWLDSQRRYASQEAEKLGSPEHSPTGWPDRLRTMIWPAAPAALVYTLFVRRLILDGWPGIFYALQRTYAELLLSLELLDRRLAQRWKVESEKLEVEARGENAQKE